MSIISDALKKADRQKWNAPSVLPPKQTAQGGTMVEERPIPKPSIFQPSSQRRPFLRVEAPPIKKAHAISTTKIALITLGSCFVLFLFITLWIYMGSAKQEVVPQIQPASNAREVKTPVVLHSAPPSRPQYTEYANPAAAHGVSVIPIPRTLRNISVEKQFQLTGTSTIGNEVYALINGKLSQVGAIVDGAEVISIDKQEAVMRKDGKEFTLKLG